MKFSRRFTFRIQPPEMLEYDRKISAAACQSLRQYCEVILVSSARVLPNYVGINSIYTNVVQTQVDKNSR